MNKRRMRMITISLLTVAHAIICMEKIAQTMSSEEQEIERRLAAARTQQSGSRSRQQEMYRLQEEASRAGIDISPARHAPRQLSHPELFMEKLLAGIARPEDLDAARSDFLNPKIINSVFLSSGETLLTEAIRVGNLNAAKTILKYAGKGILDIPNRNGATALGLAIGKRDANSVKQLLSWGAHVDAKTQGTAPLIAALIDPRPGSEDVLAELIKAGAHTNVTYEGRTIPEVIDDIITGGLPQQDEETLQSKINALQKKVKALRSRAYTTR